MTVEAFSPALPVVVSGIGPYPVPFPYAAGAVVLVVVRDGLRTVLDPADYAVDPPDTTAAGTVTLTAGAAATHDGAALHIQRGTAIEQGWQGATAREIGLERQLDALAMGLQERAEEAGRSVRTMAPQPVLLPAPGKSLMWNNEGQIVAGLDSANIAAAEQILSDAAAARDVAIAAAAEAAIRFYASVAAFNAATIPVGVDHVVINISGEMISYLRAPGASGPDDLPHPSGSQWAKASLTTADLLAAVTDVIVAGRFPTYVEGTFLPELTWADKVSGTISYGSRFGSYVRIGRMVYIDMSFFNVTVARGAETGAIRVANLPYQAAANTYGTLQLRRSEGIDLRDTGSNPPASVAALITAGQTYGVLTITPANASAFNAGVGRCSAVAGAVLLQMNGWYEVQD